MLSGRTGTLAWTLYGPGTLNSLSADARDTLQVSAPGGRNGDRFQVCQRQRRAGVSHRQRHHPARRVPVPRRPTDPPGFTRSSQNISGNTADASYTRGGDQVMLMLTQNDPSSYRATLDLTALQNTASTAVSSPIAQAAENTTATTTTTPSTATNQNVLTNQTGNNPVTSADDLAGVRYMLYGAGGNLSSLSEDPSMVSFSVPQGATITNTSVNGDGTLSAQVTSGLGLQQMMDFYDQQFKSQGFALVNPTDTGAGGDNALTYIYERPSSKSRVSFNVDKQDNYLLIWDFQDYVARTGTAPVATPASAVTPAAPAATAPATTTPATVNLQNQTGDNAVVNVTGLDGVQYIFYGAAANLGNLSTAADMVRFSVPQGANITNSNVNGNGDLSAQVTSTLTLQQMMDFYDQQFKAQGFALVNPTDTGAGLDGALTYIYERPSSNSRISFSVEAEDNYRLVWDFQDYAAFNATNATTAGVAPVYGIPLYGYNYSNLRYNFYGASPNPNAVSSLTPNAQNVTIAAPPAATNVQTPVQDGQQIEVSFDSNMELREVFNFYDRQFSQQTFNQVQGQLGESENRIDARYGRGNDAAVGLSVMAQGNNRYMVMMDFTPQQ